jgi:formylglycine-generating enzyme required for sulfatase activity
MGSEMRFGKGVVIKTAMTIMPLALCFLFVFCNSGGGNSNKPASLTGQWVDASPEPDDDIEEFELFSDGTALFKGKKERVTLSGTWSVIDKRFLITISVGGTNMSEACDYKLSGYELTLIDNKGDTSICVRKEKLNEYKAKQVAVAEAKRKRVIEQALKQFVSVSGGMFTMGCTAEQGGDCDDDEKPAHTVTLKDFSIGKYEVTQALWQAVMDENPSNFKGDGNLPVETVSWNDVQGFIQKLNEKTGKKYRLPTEAEWEYAARGGNKSKGYKFSGSQNIENAGWYVGNSGDTPMDNEEMKQLLLSEKYDEYNRKLRANNNKTKPVGTKQPNELGIYDMTGNVWEWVSDWYGGNYYSSSSDTNPTGPNSGSYRVHRGGSWTNDAGYCRVSNRHADSPGNGDYSLGFRLAVSP